MGVCEKPLGQEEIAPAAHRVHKSRRIYRTGGGAVGQKVSSVQKSELQPVQSVHTEQVVRRRLAVRRLNVSWLSRSFLISIRPSSFF